MCHGDDVASAGFAFRPGNSSGSGFAQAAEEGSIHSDIARGFIRAEVVAFDSLKECGNKHAAKEKGVLRLEGKEYIVHDGDVIEYRFAV